MAEDPRRASTLDEAGRNPNGTYNGFRVLSWLSEALHPGGGISEEEIRAEVEQQRLARRARRARLRRHGLY